MLDGDITRCLGLNAGILCPRRKACQRFLAMVDDAVNDHKTGQRPFRSHAAMLCRLPDTAYFWPAENTKPGAGPGS
jgi:hypothetical protein